MGINGYFEAEHDVMTMMVRLHHLFALMCDPHTLEAC